MNLHEYYRNHKDAINASIMDIACDLAVGRLLNAHGAPFETFVEADDPDDPDGGTHYKEEYQKEYDTYYDKEYARVAKLMKFDYCQEDGVAASPEDTNTVCGKAECDIIGEICNFADFNTGGRL